MAARSSTSVTARIGEALTAPRLALLRADDLDRAGTAGTDATALLLAFYLVAALGTFVHGVWTMAAGDLMGGLSTLLTSASHTVMRDVVTLMLAGLALFVVAGGSRSLGRDFDLACVAFVPVMAARITDATVGALWAAAPTWVGWALYGAGALWGLWIWWLAVSVARRRDGDLPVESTGGHQRVGWLVWIVAAVGLVTGTARIARHPETVRPLTRGDLAPVFALHEIGPRGGISRDRVSLDSQRGNVVVVDFWATWCGPCRQSMPVIQRLYRRYRDQGLTVLSINTEGADATGHARRVADSMGLEFTLLLDDGSAGARYKVSTIPHMVVIGPTGQIEHVHRGFAGAARLERQLGGEIEQLLRMRKRLSK